MIRKQSARPASFRPLGLVAGVPTLGTGPGNGELLCDCHEDSRIVQEWCEARFGVQMLFGAHGTVAMVTKLVVCKSSLLARVLVLQEFS